MPAATSWPPGSFSLLSRRVYEPPTTSGFAGAQSIFTATRFPGRSSLGIERVSLKAATMASWLSLATAPRTVRRGLRYAAIVGTLLISINYGDMILRGTLPPGALLRMALTVMVPYVVSTLSSVEAVRAANGRLPPMD